MSADDEYLVDDGGRPSQVRIRNTFFTGPAMRPVSELRPRTRRERVGDRLILWADVLNGRDSRLMWVAMRLYRLALRVRG